MPKPEVRDVLLQVISECAPKRPGDSNLQSRSILTEVRDRLGGARDHVLEEAILTAFHDLLRTGYLAWGFNLANPDPPFFHLTEQGRKSLANLSRDPSNPAGYLASLSQAVTLNSIADAYLREALACFVNDLPKASAVMVGGASESIALELRDAVVGKLQSMNRNVPRGMDDWRLKVVLDAMYSFLDQNSGQMKKELRDSFRSYWSAFLQQIRTARNDAGHPSSVDPVTFDTVHASLLIFPELAKLTFDLLQWINHEYK
ncbi:MAG: hypothetical protein CVU51_00250 [Deltaproteobacteria bacterium HGW-Deltaproteobacteria-1]|nr:MAG: hypothetical protein CVU51_00250 [Deltaproteobacteria bacterium HGW-Deltaproteobacteria-1]